MRLVYTLLVIGAATLFARGNAFPTGEQTKILSTNLLQSAAAVQNDRGDGKRLLRFVETTPDDGDDEERGWLDLKGLFTGTAQNLARKAAKEEEAIKGFATEFSHWNAKDKLPLDIYNNYIIRGYSEKKAMEMGLRYETFLNNPSAYS